MAKAPARAVSDDELLRDEEEAPAEDALDGLDLTAEDETPQAEDAKDDDLEVVILDEDEGKDKEKAEVADEKDAEVVGQDEDDTGEVVETPQFLTEWEKKNYSQAMQQRVMRERRAKKAEADARLAAETRADTEARGRQAAEANLRASEKLSATLLSDLFGRDIVAKTALLKAAKEAGNTDDELKLQGELEDLRAKKRDVDAAKDRLEKAPATEEKPAVNPLTEQWMGRNRWFNDKAFERQRRLTMTLDRELAEEVKSGTFRHQANTAEYFAELDKRIHAEMPQLRARIRQAYGGPTKTQARVAPVSRAAPARTAGNGKVFLTKDDLENARNFGVDTSDKKQLAEYARNKRAREQQERAANG